MSHYFENEDTLQSKERNLTLYIEGQNIFFVSDVGVFSNTKIDYGSYTFLKTLLKEKKVKNVLDVGCGYGVLAITLKLFDKCENATLIDINPRAVRLCETNIKYHQLSSCLETFESDCFEKVTDKYDRIVINPPIRAGKIVIYKMFEQSVNFLNDNGELFIVIKKDLGAQSAIKKLQTIYKNVEVIQKDKGYFIIKSFN